MTQQINGIVLVYRVIGIYIRFNVHRILVREYHMDFDGIQLFKVFSDGIILVTGKTRADSVITYYGADGEIKFTKSFQYSVLDAKMIDDNIYLLTDGAVYRFDEDGLAKAEAESGAGEMFVFDDGNVMLCYEANTKLIKKNEFKVSD